jgi:hypothetical protein
MLFDTEGEWAGEFERIRCEDPLAALNLDFDSFDIGKGIGKEALEKEGWPAGKPHWAIFDSKGRIVADGAHVPTAAQLADACAGADIVGKAETFRRFLREHPNHEEARGAMLQEMLEIAEVRTRHFLRILENSPSGIRIVGDVDGMVMDSHADMGPTAEQLENLPALGADADESIWGEYCAILQRHLEGAWWQSGPSSAKNAQQLSDDTRSMVSPWVGFSPAAKAAYSNVVPRVEAALVRQPISPSLWKLWISMRRVGAGKSVKELLDTLKPGPNVAPGDWPPPSVRPLYLKMCRETGDWDAIRELVGPGWVSVCARADEMFRDIGDDTRASLSKMVSLGDLAGFSQGFWHANAEAYLEALLRQQRLSEAEQMMKTWASGEGWPGALLAAAAIANGLGYDGLAKAWRGTGEKK